LSFVRYISWNGTGYVFAFSDDIARFRSLETPYMRGINEAIEMFFHTARLSCLRNCANKVRWEGEAES
jgi:hypothetical protein